MCLHYNCDNKYFAVVELNKQFAKTKKWEEQIYNW